MRNTRRSIHAFQGILVVSSAALLLLWSGCVGQSPENTKSTDDESRNGVVISSCFDACGSTQDGVPNYSPSNIFETYDTGTGQHLQIRVWDLDDSMECPAYVNIWNEAPVKDWMSGWLFSHNDIVSLRWSDGLIYGRNVRLDVTRNDQTSQWVVRPRPNDHYFSISTNEGDEYCLQAPTVGAGNISPVLLKPCDNNELLQGWQFYPAGRGTYWIRNATTIWGRGRCLVNRPLYGSSLIMGDCTHPTSILGRNHIWRLDQAPTVAFAHRRLEADGDGNDNDIDNDGDACFVDPNDVVADPLHCPDTFCSEEDAAYCKNLEHNHWNPLAGCINAHNISYCMYEWDETFTCPYAMVEPFRQDVFGVSLGEFCGREIGGNSELPENLVPIDGGSGFNSEGYIIWNLFGPWDGPLDSCFTGHDQITPDGEVILTTSDVTLSLSCDPEQQGFLQPRAEHKIVIRSDHRLDWVQWGMLYSEHEEIIDDIEMWVGDGWLRRDLLDEDVSINDGTSEAFYYRFDNHYSGPVWSQDTLWIGTITSNTTLRFYKDPS